MARYCADIQVLADVDAYLLGGAGDGVRHQQLLTVQDEVYGQFLFTHRVNKAEIQLRVLFVLHFHRISHRNWGVQVSVFFVVSKKFRYLFSGYLKDIHNIDNLFV